MTPCFSSSTGMRRGRVMGAADTPSIGPPLPPQVIQERREEIEAVILALLGVELDAEEIAGFDRDGNGFTRIVDRRRDARRVGGFQAIAVDMIEAAAASLGEKHAAPRRRHIAPADIGHAKARIAGREARDAPAHETKSLVAPVLLAFFGEKLHPEADAEDRRACGDSAAERLDERLLPETRHPVAEGADA